MLCRTSLEENHTRIFYYMEWQDHLRGQRIALEPSQRNLEEFSAGISTVSLLAEQPFTYAALTELLQAPRTLTSTVPLQGERDSSSGGQSP